MKDRTSNSRARLTSLLLPVILMAVCVAAFVTCDRRLLPPETDPGLIAAGKDIFEFDTFGDERFWTETLRMHEVISSAGDPTPALSVGLKVDTDSLPPAVVQGIQNGSISLTD